MREHHTECVVSECFFLWIVWAFFFPVVLTSVLHFCANLGVVLPNPDQVITADELANLILKDVGLPQLPRGRGGGHARDHTFPIECAVHPHLRRLPDPPPHPTVHKFDPQQQFQCLQSTTLSNPRAPAHSAKFFVRQCVAFAKDSSIDLGDPEPVLSIPSGFARDASLFVGERYVPLFIGHP